MFPEAIHASVELNDFESKAVLGTGAFGIVHLVRKLKGIHKSKTFAMKVLEKSRLVNSRKSTEHTLTERFVLEAIRGCPFLVNLHYAFQTIDKLFLVMDFVSGGELFIHLDQRGTFNENETRFYLGEMVLGLEVLHGLDIVYRDLKLENVLLDSHGHVVLTDFGLSKRLKPNCDGERRTYSYCGTLGYMAPEIISRTNHGHSFGVDWWSLGVLAYELLTGEVPFHCADDKDSHEHKRLIMTTEPIFSTDLKLEEETKDFISKLLIKDPVRRLGSGTMDAREVRSHQFFKNMDWEDLFHKRIAPPFQPKVMNDLDVSNFDPECTGLLPKISTDENAQNIPSNFHKIHGFEFISPEEVSSRLEKSKELNAAESLIHLQASPPNFYQNYSVDYNEPILGAGSYSVCYRCVHKTSQAEFAVKTIYKKFNCENEIEALIRCKGMKNVIELYEFYQDDNFYYLVIDYLKGGELFQRIENKELNEIRIAKIMKTLIETVHALHAKNIVHRDLKPENIVFVDDHSDEFKLIDFGFACYNPERKPMDTPCYSVPYGAPEVVASEMGYNSYDERCDLWSLGVILHAMLSGRFVGDLICFKDCPMTVLYEIEHDLFSVNGPEWESVSEEAKRITHGLLQVDPSDRLQLSEVLESNWILEDASATFYPVQYQPVSLATQSLERFSTTNGCITTSNFEALDLAIYDREMAPLDLSVNSKKQKRLSPYFDNRSKSDPGLSNESCDQQTEDEMQFDSIEAQLKEMNHITNDESNKIDFNIDTKASFLPYYQILTTGEKLEAVKSLEEELSHGIEDSPYASMELVINISTDLSIDQIDETPKRKIDEWDETPKRKNVGKIRKRLIDLFENNVPKISNDIKEDNIQFSGIDIKPTRLIDLFRCESPKVTKQVQQIKEKNQRSSMTIPEIQHNEMQAFFANRIGLKLFKRKASDCLDYDNLKKPRG